MPVKLQAARKTASCRFTGTTFFQKILYARSFLQSPTIVYS